jgi:hypothetical protein
MVIRSTTAASDRGASRRYQVAQPAEWYSDPSGRYQYRYWDGSQWTNQVSSGGPSAVDPNPLDVTVINTPPAPGSQAALAQQPEPAAPQPAVLGALVALVVVIILVAMLMAGSDDDTTDTTLPTDTTEEPAPTEAPPEE